MLLHDVTFSKGKHFMWRNKFMKRVLLIRKLQQQRCKRNLKNSMYKILSTDFNKLNCASVIVRGVGYLRRELEHGSADDERSRMMLGSQSQCVCAVNRPQTPVSQNRLCADDHLNNTSDSVRYLLN